jgi:hypothetical protein
LVSTLRAGILSTALGMHLLTAATTPTPDASSRGSSGFGWSHPAI